ncbi:hypothetical protein [Paenibacillus psychroresistens]|uniref:hypothetical protein n=1 Tax=Paenibacillus psychroresistens TaxID=1778678 RepID=UPI001D04259A|nr:hypothetical protein [Paenibacillus psychroresistens]
MNITSEICSQHYNTEAFYMENDQIVVLLNMSTSFADLNDSSLKRILPEVQNALNTYLKLSISIMVSSESMN